MRVPFINSNEQFSRQVGVLNHKQVALQKQLSSGQRVYAASDDSKAVGRALDAASEKSRIQAYDRNLGRAELVGKFSLGALEQFKEVADTVSGLALTNDGLSTSASLSARGQHMTQLVEQALNTLNSQLSGDYIFAGANTGETPYLAHRYTEFLEDADGNYVDLEGNALGVGAPPVPSVLRDASGAIIFDPLLDSSGNPVAEGTYVDPGTGFQTDGSGAALPGPVSIEAGIDFTTGEFVRFDTGAGTWDPVLDDQGNPIVPVTPDSSGTGFMTTTRSVPEELMGQVSHVEYTGTTSAADDVRFSIGEKSMSSPFSRGASNEEYARVVNDMIALRDALYSEDIDAVRAEAGRFEETQELVTYGMVEFGAKLQGLDVLSNVNSARFQALETDVSNAVDADITETIVALNRSQVAYEAALNSGARILNMSLLDFLR